MFFSFWACIYISLRIIDKFIFPVSVFFCLIIAFAFLCVHTYASIHAVIDFCLHR